MCSMRSTYDQQKKWRQKSFILGVLIFLAGLLWFLWSTYVELQHFNHQQALTQTDLKLEQTVYEPLPTLAQSASQVTLDIVYNQSTWAEIIDADGRIMTRKLMAAGQSQTLFGIAPIQVFLGNGVGVQVKLNGVLFHHWNWIDDSNVAKFKLP